MKNNLNKRRKRSKNLEAGYIEKGGAQNPRPLQPFRQQ